MNRVLPAVAVVGLAAISPLSAQPVRTQQYDAVSQPEQIDSTTQATNLRFRKDHYDRMTVPVRVAGHGPYRFLVDTGADRTAISWDMARELRLTHPDMETAVLHSVSGISDVTTATVPVLTIASKQVRNVEAPLLEASNMGADGILGLDSLHSQRILFDFKKETLTIVPSSPRMPDVGGTIVVTGRIRNGRLILANAKANNVGLTLVVDTGAQISVGNEALRNKLFRKAKKSGAVELQSVTGAKINGQYMIVRELEVGGVTLKDLPIVFADSHAFARLGLKDRPALLLGMNALRGFEKVSIDFAKKKLRVVLPEESSLTRTRFASL
jgi:predicted aspartyl protease